jgi:uncharacterized protein
MRRAVVIVWVVWIGACVHGADPAPRRIRIATGDPGGVYYPLGAALSRVYTHDVPMVRAEAVPTVASAFNVDAVEEGRAELAFTQGDVAYLSYTAGTSGLSRPHRNLRAIAVLYPNIVQVVTRRDGPVYRIADLRGRRVGVGAPGSGTEIAARIIIEANQLDYSDFRPEPASFTDLATRIENGTLDGGFVVASYPVPAITSANSMVGVRLLPIEPPVVARLRSQYPFFRPGVVPEGTYPGQRSNVQTVIVDNLLVCSTLLDERLVYQLTKRLFESLDVLVRAHVAAAQVDPARGPTTPLPLHPGAARYYRERELLQ